VALSADKILAHAGNFKTREVHVPAWVDESGDDVVLVRGITIREWEIHQGRMQRNASDDKPTGDANAALIAAAAVDANGGKLFNAGHIAQIKELGSGDVIALSNAIMELSGLTGDDDEQAEADKKLAGESDAQTSNSSSE
jgi:hypothetical protein